MNYLSIDIKRYKELTGSNIIMEPSAVIIILFRIAQYFNRIKLMPIRLIANILLIPIYRFFTIFLGISLPRNCKIGPGLVIFHYGAIVINENVNIGSNCTIRQGVTIGSKKRNDDVPTIGDNVEIGAGAIIIGSIKIGNNVIIGANALVINDVPANHIAVGVPARILQKKKI
jgi:serine O-acetyltransferase